MVLNDTVLQQLQWRYATKKFDPERRIPDDVWRVLAQSLVLTPSSYGLQPWKFLVVVDPAIKASLPTYSWGQSQPRDCSHMVVLAIKSDLGETDIDRHLHRVAEVRSQEIDALNGFRQMLVANLTKPTFPINEWAARQVYIALGQLMATAAILGVDACPMEGIDPDRYDEVLGLAPRGYRTVVGCALGYRASDDRHAKLPKVRFRIEDVVETV